MFVQRYHGEQNADDCYEGGKVYDSIASCVFSLHFHFPSSQCCIFVMKRGHRNDQRHHLHEERRSRLHSHRTLTSSSDPLFHYIYELFFFNFSISYPLSEFANPIVIDAPPTPFRRSDFFNRYFCSCLNMRLSSDFMGIIIIFMLTYSLFGR